MNYILKFLFVNILFVVIQSATIFSKDWQAYKKKLNLKYDSSRLESDAYEKWQFNLDKIKQINSNKSKSFRYGLTSFTHLSSDEYKNKMLISVNDVEDMSRLLRGLVNERGSFSDFLSNIFNPIPNSFSWIDKGFVSSVKYQANCGSCYAFAVTGAIEVLYANKHNSAPLDLSEQQIISCSNYLTVDAKYKPNQGCNGGTPKPTLQYIIDKGLMRETDYPYTETTSFGSSPTNKPCYYNENKTLFRLSGYNEINSLTQVKSMMIALVRHGPLITWVNGINFQNYVSGVYDATTAQCNPKNLNHLFLIVGYGRDSVSGKDFWLVKNSYGTSWGENGYIRVKRGSNVCGIEKNSFYPVI